MIQGIKINFVVKRCKFKRQQLRISMLRSTRCAVGLTTSWGYDANGNRTQENGSTIASYDNEDRLQSWKSNSYAYNAAGDLASKTTPTGSSSYSYDVQGNLRSVSLPDGKNITYAIDPMGRRTGKSINGALQWQMVWLSSLRPLARLNADGTLDETYYYGDKPNVPEAMSKGANTYRIISDQNGSVRLVIDANTGTVAQQMDYDVWGNVVNDTNPGFQPFGFAGGLYDSDTKLTRFGARDYDAETGRWTSKDPILFGGGNSNLFGYVGQDPVNGIDPYGLRLCRVNLPNITGNNVFPYLDDDFYERVNMWLFLNQLNGIDVEITDLFRPPGRQAHLGTNAITPAAPGNSLHEAGFAIDISYRDLSPDQREVVIDNAYSAGLRWGGDFRRLDVVHFDYDPGNRKDWISNARQDYLTGDADECSCDY